MSWSVLDVKPDYDLVNSLLENPCFTVFCFFFSHSTRLLAATTLRNVLGTKNLSQILGMESICLSIVDVMSNSNVSWFELFSWERIYRPHHAECSGWGDGSLGSESGAGRNVRTFILYQVGQTRVLFDTLSRWKGGVSGQFLIVDFFSSEKMSDCQFTCREPWPLKLRLPERLEPRWDTEK